MAFDWLKTGLGKLEDIKKSALKFKSKEFLEAVVAASYMVASADGNVDSDEKTKLLNFLKIDEQLRVYSPGDIITMFNKYKDLYEFDADVANASALKAIGKFSENKEKSNYLIRLVCSIGAADGSFDQNERDVVRKICTELNIEPSQFEL